MMKMYTKLLERKPGQNATETFLDYITTYMESPQEVECSFSAIGMFFTQYADYGCDGCNDYIPVLWVEENDNVIEYYIVTERDIIKHWKDYTESTDGLIKKGVKR